MRKITYNNLHFQIIQYFFLDGIILSTIFYTFTSVMKKIPNHIYMRIASQSLPHRVKRWISPIFIMMLLASFILWYISKLSYSYTTELEVNVEIEQQPLEVRCVVEGVGTNLFGYKIKGGEDIDVPIEELRYDVVDSMGVVVLNENSLSTAISVRFSDIKIISIDYDNKLRLTPELRREIKKNKK